MADPTPLEDLVVNERFWLGYARDVVQKSAANRLATADKLVTATGWFWTVYSAIAIVGVGLSDRQLGHIRIAVVLLPIPLLAVTYLLSLRAASTIESAFDARIPKEISDAYEFRMHERSRRIRHAVVVLVLSAVSVVSAGFASGFSSPKKDETPSLTATRAPTADGAGTIVLFEVHAKAGTSQIQVRLVGQSKDIPAQLGTTDANGRFTGQFIAAGISSASDLSVQATWTNGDKVVVTFLDALPGQKTNVASNSSTP